MAHEIYENDGAVYAKETWHGLGKYVGSAMDPKEAMLLAGLNWGVKKTPVYASFNNENIYDDSYAAVVREDTQTILSIQSSDYKVVQNSEVFDLAYALSDTVKVESAFSMGNGKKLVVLLKAGSFNATSDDTVDEYLALVSSHDGSIALSGLPTSVRIVCNNTLNMALNANRANKGQMFRVTHSGDMDTKLSSMRTALRRFADTRSFFEKQVITLASRAVTKQDLQKFWFDVWGLVEEPIITNPQTEAEEKNYKASLSAVSAWANTFDEERGVCNALPSYWLAANAATKWLQFKNPARGRKPSEESRLYNNLLGDQQKLSLAVMNHALSLVG